MNDPPANPGVAFNSANGPYVGGVAVVMYSCISATDILVPDPSENTCNIDGAWDNVSPTCFRKSNVVCKKLIKFHFFRRVSYLQAQNYLFIFCFINFIDACL